MGSIPCCIPAVMVEELDNYALERTQDSGSLENHAGLMYEINVFSNLMVGKKSQAKSIFKDIDAVMAGLGSLGRSRRQYQTWRTPQSTEWLVDIRR